MYIRLTHPLPLPFVRLLAALALQKVWVQRVTSKEVPHPELPASAAPGELPCEPDWSKYDADLPSGPPKHGHGPPSARIARRGQAGGAGGADMAQLVQLRMVRLLCVPFVYRAVETVF